MTYRPTTAERAMQLAGSGHINKVTEIKFVLKREGFSGVEMTLNGAGFRTQLRRLMQKAKLSPPRF